MKSIIIVIMRLKNINKFIHNTTAALHSNMQNLTLKKEKKSC